MLAWVDVEADGLDPKGHLLEVAIVVTTDDLQEVSHLSTIINPVGVDLEEMIAKCDPVVQEMHTNNGLFAELRAGGGTRRHEAEEMFAGWLQQAAVLGGNVELDVCVHCKKKLSEHNHAFVGGQGTEDIPSSCQGDVLKHYTPKIVTLASQTPLAGSTVGFDRRFLHEHMPKLEALFSYRSVDCSSLTELAKRWAPSVYEARPRAEHAAHRALADVRESISILRFYRDRGFVGGGNFA